MISAMTSEATMATARTVADAVAGPVLIFGRGWMMAEETAATATGSGFAPPFGLWVNGRAGVLGDVDADVAAAAIGFMAPDRVRTYWEARPAGMSPGEATRIYAGAAADWGRRVLADESTADLERLAELADRVAAAATPSIGALFAGWRALARPEDPAGRVTIVLNVLRELRGGAHLSAVHAVGLGPHAAIFSTDDPVRGGAAGAERFGWPKPHPEPDPAARAEAERLTTVICAPPFAALDGSEQGELVELATRARAAMGG